MLSVLLVHSMLFLAPFALYHSWPIRNHVTSPLYYYAVLLIHIWNMPLFYLIGGFFSRQMFEKYGGWKFFYKRLFRIGLPFLIGYLLLSFYHVGSFIAYIKGGLSLSWQHVYDIFSFIGPLWFLYCLLLFYVMVLCGQYIYSFIFKRTLNLPPLFLVLLFIISGFGIFFLGKILFLYPPLHLTIEACPLLFYFSFFLFGWILYTRPKDLTFYGNYGWIFLLLALGLCFPVFAWLSHNKHMLGLYSNLDYWVMLLNPINAWLLTLGLLGVFYQWLSRYSRNLRFLADASYWFYLIQVPIVLVIQAYFTFHNLPMFLKLIYVYIIALAIMTLTYLIFVRKTYLGVILNGERK